MCRSHDAAVKPRSCTGVHAQILRRGNALAAGGGPLKAALRALRCDLRARCSKSRRMITHAHSLMPSVDWLPLK
jgi:hypothetical protein